MRRLGILAAIGVSLAACTARDFTTNNRADVILRVNKIQGGSGTSGGASGTTGSQLFSDVLTCTGVDSATGLETGCSVFNDNAVITLEVVQKNPTATLTNFEDVVLTTYKVEYIRADGRGVEGIDVPFTISGNVSALITVGNTSDVSIIVVRQQAKNEPPLRNMIGGGGAVLMTASAKITVFGKTTSGKDVSATGYLEIVFGDFGP